VIKYTSFPKKKIQARNGYEARRVRGPFWTL